MEEPLSVVPLGHPSVDPVDNDWVFHLDQKLVLRTVRASTLLDPVFAMDEIFSFIRGSRLAVGLSRICVDQDDAAGAILQMEMS